MAKAKGDFYDALAAWMREHGVTNPREVPDVVVEALRVAHS
jgi:hypothetical protein